MKRFLSATAIVGFLATLLLRSEEQGVGVDVSPDVKLPSDVSKPKQEMDEFLRPGVFTRYKKLPKLGSDGKGLYQALYRVPKSAYGSDYFYELPEVSKWLEGEGVEFGKGSLVAFDAKSRILEVVQTIPQLTRTELFLARFGGEQDIHVDLEVFQLPLWEGWELIGEATGLVDHSSIRDDALEIVRNGNGRIVESLSSLLRSGSRGKVVRPGTEEASEEDYDPAATHFEFDVVSGPTGISGGTESRIYINFAYSRPAGEFAQRKVTHETILPHTGAVIASSWKEGDSIQVLFLSGSVRTVNAVTRVRRVTEISRK